MALLRIFTVNLLVDRADPDDLASAIGHADPDVIVVQELGERCAGVIGTVHPHSYLDPRGDGFGMGIASRYSLTVERIEIPGRPAWAGRLDPETWPGLRKPLDVVDVHLMNPIDRPWRDSRDTRRRQIAGIVEFVSSREGASVVIGDMNATPAWPEYKALCEIGVDAARATGTTRRTWSHFLSGPRLLRIDHAFVAGARPITTTVVPILGSDHSALIVDLEV